MMMETYQNQFESAAQEIARHIEDATISKAAHFAIAARYNNRESTLQRTAAVSFSGVVLSWYISTQLYAVLDGLGWIVYPAIKMATQSAIPTGFIIANLIATTFLFLNRYGDKAYRHREAAQKYHRFFRKCINWRTECPAPSYVLVAMATAYREELSEINDSSPDIEEWAWSVAHEELNNGGNKYNVDKEKTT